MKTYIAILASFLLVSFATAGGSLSWVEVSQRLAKDCPELLKVIDQCFDVKPVGGAARLGPRSIDVIEGRAGTGSRVPPYEFDCKVKGSTDSYPLCIEINDSDDGWKFIVGNKHPGKPTKQ